MQRVASVILRNRLLVAANPLVQRSVVKCLHTQPVRNKSGINLLATAAAIGTGIFLYETTKGDTTVKAEIQKEGALVDAAMFNKREDLLRLLESGASPNKKNKSGFSALYVAAAEGNLDIIKDLIKFGADVNLDVESDSPLQAALINQHHDAAMELMKMGADPNHLNADGLGALHFSVGLNDKIVTKALLRAGAQANIHEAHELMTPLHVACDNADAEMAALLIQAGANVDARSRDGNTALFGAVVAKNFDMVKLLVNKGANVELGPIALYEGVEASFTPLHAAVQLNNLEIVKTLIRGGADVTARVPALQNWSILHSAALYCDPSIIQTLVKAGGEVNAKLHNGPTPVVLAASKGRTEVVKEFVRLGAHVDESTVQVAKNMGHPDTASELAKLSKK